MLRELSMELSNHSISYFQSSRLQGVLMEQIDSGYAEILHLQGLKPYSLAVRREKGRTFWYVRTLTDEAYEKIICVLRNPDFHSFKLKNISETFEILHKSVKEKSEKELMNDFYAGIGEMKYINILFETPTAFKSGGRYVIYPELKNVYFSLMNKYSAVCEDTNMLDQDLLEQLSENSEIVRYKLHSLAFPIEGIKIPAFMGEIGICISGPHTLASYANMLCEFGEYSGIGIKTAMGMGSIKIERRERDDRQRT